MRCDRCGRFTKTEDLTRQPYTQADYLFGGDPIYLCVRCPERPAGSWEPVPETDQCECESRHRPGARWFNGEDRTLTCEQRPGHRSKWHKRGSFEWDDAHAEPDPAPNPERTGDDRG